MKLQDNVEENKVEIRTKALGFIVMRINSPCRYYDCSQIICVDLICI